MPAPPTILADKLACPSTSEILAPAPFMEAQNHLPSGTLHHASCPLPARKPPPAHSPPPHPMSGARATASLEQWHAYAITPPYRSPRDYRCPHLCLRSALAEATPVLPHGESRWLCPHPRATHLLPHRSHPRGSAPFLLPVPSLASLSTRPTIHGARPGDPPSGTKTGSAAVWCSTRLGAPGGGLWDGDHDAWAQEDVHVAQGQDPGAQGRAEHCLRLCIYICHHEHMSC
jgi:hypothetical protein